MLHQKHFQTTINEKGTDLYFIENNTIKAAFTNYGARLVSLLVPDKNGNLIDVHVGFDSIEKYIQAKDQSYGAVVGRYAGRIANGKFNIDGHPFQLDINNGNNAIHGGNTGFQTRVWDVQQISKDTIVFKYVSADGEEAYPGTLTISVTYQLTNKNELKITFEYSCNKKTIANIIHHNFFNLNGEGSGSITNHSVKILTDKFNAINEDCIPTHIESVKDTPFDFTTFKRIGENIHANDAQIKNGTGYDHTFAFDKGVTKHPELVAQIIGDKTDIAMELYTTEPGLHLYTGNFMSGAHTFKCGIKDDLRTAISLEAQHYPNSPNEPTAPSTIKENGVVYKSITIYKFV
jgi:aldose 1-epimerase